MTPFAFYADLLGAQRGRQRLLARLGHEAADAIDEFLNLALEYERIETPSLQGFVAWLRSAQAEVKRDMEMARDEVRVMTVHGAKGLEAPIVILADTTTPPQGFHPPRLLQLSRKDGPPPLLWATAKVNDVGPMEAARNAALGEARDEYRRLLYVAMTRAIERLIVCGVDGLTKRPEGCWYDLARNALETHCVREPADDGDGDVLRYRKATDAPPAKPAKAPAPELALLPPWLTQMITEAAASAPIRPSGFVDDHEARSLLGPREARRRAIARGVHVHRLMQSLPDIAPTLRAEAARRYLARQRNLDDAARVEIAEHTLRLLGDLRFDALFLPGSRAEVSIVGNLGGRPVSGQVDRLVVTDKEILIADYKTNRPAPLNLADAKTRHPSYIMQLALYRAVLMRLYSDRPIRAALLWTDTPALMEIPPDALDHALNSPPRESP